MIVYLGVLAGCAPASAATRPEVQGVSIVGDDSGAKVEIDMSVKTAYTISVRPERVEIDLPNTGWQAQTPKNGGGAGLIQSYRKMSSARGIRLVLDVTTPIHIQSSALTPDDDSAGPKRLTLELVRDQGNFIANPVVDAPPVVEQFNGLSFYPPPVVVLTTPSTPVAPPPAKPAKAVECVAHETQECSIGNTPVYKYSGCQ